MKKSILSIIAILVAIFFPLNVLAKEKEEVNEPINVYLFWGNGCGYCEAAKEFFVSIEEEYGDKFDLVAYEVWNDEKNQALEQAVAEYLGEEVSGVPYIVIGEKTFNGYSSEYDEDIIEAIEDEYENDDRIDVLEKIDAGEVSKSSEKNYDTLIVIGIFAVIIGGFGALIYFSRK